MSCCETEVKYKSEENSAICPISSGEQRCAPGYTWGAGVRFSYIIHYIISGRGVFYCGPNKFELRAGDIFVIYPGTVVKYVADESDPWHYAWINFRGNDSKQIFSKMGITPLAPIKSVECGERMVNIIRTMPTERNADIQTNLGFSQKLYEILLLLMSDGEPEERTENSYLTAAVRYVKAHYNENISVEGISDHIGISRKYLFAIFKKLKGVSPKEYIIDYRIRRAKELLSNTDISIANVAYSVGYSDPLMFSKMFKIRVGVSPREYRVMIARSGKSEA